RRVLFRSKAREGFEHLTDGEPRRRPGEAIRRDRFDEAVEKMFAAADRDRDGTVTLEELRTAIESRKAAAIRGRFASIDADRNESISFPEFDRWQRGLGSIVLSDEGAAAASEAVVSEDIGPEPMRGPGGMVLARLRQHQLRCRRLARRDPLLRREAVRGRRCERRRLGYRRRMRAAPAG